jgi:hypothetical protein
MAFSRPGQTGKLLSLDTLALPPGLLCSVALHTLHGVAPVATRTRYGSLFAFRAAGPPSISRWWTRLSYLTMPLPFYKPV